MNILENNLFKLEKTVFDDKFNVDNLHLYQLNLALDHQSLSIFVYNTSTQTALLLEKYNFVNTVAETTIIQVLESIFSSHSYINAGFWKAIKVIYKSKNFTFIPNTLFDPTQKESYLKLCTEYNASKESIIFQKNEDLGFTTVFSIETLFLNFFKNKYPVKEVQIVTHISSFIKLLVKEKYNEKENNLFIFGQDSKISIVKFKKEGLEYANTFDFRSSEDLTYYTMLVINELGLNPDIINLTIWGNIDTNSLFFKRLAEYVKNISLGRRPEGLKYGFQFDEVDEAEFYDLIGVSL